MIKNNRQFRKSKKVLTELKDELSDLYKNKELITLSRFLHIEFLEKEIKELEDEIKEYNNRINNNI